MALFSFTLTALMAAVPLPPLPDVSCQFSPESGGPPVQIVLTPQTETPRPGLFRVGIQIAGQQTTGSVSALERTAARDMLVRGQTGDGTIWLIAIRDTGIAYLQTRGAQADAKPVGTVGHCRHQRPAIDL